MKSRSSNLLSIALTAIVATGGLSVASPAAAATVKSVAAQGSASASASNELIASQDNTGTITVNRSTLLATQLVSVRITSTCTCADVILIRPKAGVSLQEIDTKLEEANQGGAIGAAAMVWFNGDRNNSPNVALRGGLGTAGSPEAPSTISFTRTLTAGTYYLTQMRAFGDAKPSTKAKKITVTGSPVASWTFANQRLTVVNAGRDSGYADSFSAYNTVVGAVDGREIKTNSPITVANKTGGITSPNELHFFEWTQVLADTTNEQVCASYSGGPSRFVPNGGKQVFGTLSTGEHVNYNLTVPPGLYWITSWIPDTNSGVSHALEHPADYPARCEGLIIKVVSQIATTNARRANFALAG